MSLFWRLLQEQHPDLSRVASGQYLYHTTSWGSAEKILSENKVKAGRTGYSSFSEVPLFGADLRGEDLAIILYKEDLDWDLMPVKYESWWIDENPDHALYVGGDSWLDYFDMDMDVDMSDALYPAFKRKAHEKEWVSREKGESVYLRRIAGIAVPKAQDVPKAEELLEDLEIEGFVKVVKPVQIQMYEAPQEEYHDEGFVGDNGGSKGSGLLVTDGTRVLLLERSRDVADPMTWSVPGGAIPRKGSGYMDAKKSALKEGKEELGRLPKGKIGKGILYKKGDGFEYTTFLYHVDPEVLSSYKPYLNWEHSDWAVEPIEGLIKNRRYKLHPGFEYVLKKLS